MNGARKTRYHRTVREWYPNQVFGEGKIRVSRLNDHYQFLGLDVSASREAIQRAVDQLEEQADVLAYTSPHRSNEMWDRLRQVRHDLLSDSERRATYDGAVRASRAAPLAPGTIPPIGPVSRKSRVEAHRHVGPVVVAGAVAAGLALATASQITDRTITPSRPVAMLPSVTGQRHSGLFVSGERATLQWHRVPGATRYRLHILIASSSGRLLPYRTVVTSATRYSLVLMGPRRYVWQAQPFVDGRWHRASRREVIEVSRPTIGVPIPLSPTTHSALIATEVELCWSRVDGAVGYHVRIRSVGGVNVSDTCQWMSVHPGTYRWSVAARVRGAHIYTGPFTAGQYFAVVPQVAAIYPPTARRAGLVPLGHSSGRHWSSGHHARAHYRQAHRASAPGSRLGTPAAPVEVAAVVPVRSADRSGILTAAPAAGSSSRSVGGAIRRAIGSSISSRGSRRASSSALSAERVGTSPARGGVAGSRLVAAAASAAVGSSVHPHAHRSTPPAQPASLPAGPAQVAIAAPVPTASAALPSSAALYPAARSASPIYSAAPPTGTGPSQSSGASTYSAGATTYSAGPQPGAYQAPAAQQPAAAQAAQQSAPPASAPSKPSGPMAGLPPVPAPPPQAQAASGHPAHGKKH